MWFFFFDDDDMTLIITASLGAVHDPFIHIWKHVNIIEWAAAIVVERQV